LGSNVSSDFVKEYEFGEIKGIILFNMQKYNILGMSQKHRSDKKIAQFFC
jgi:hypothetical protein